MTAITKEDVLHELRWNYDPEENLELTIHVFEAIRSLRNRFDGYIPGKAIQNYAGCGATALTKHVKRLEHIGAITVIRRPESYNHYEISTLEAMNAEAHTER